MRKKRHQDIRAYSARELEVLGCGDVSGIRKIVKREKIKPVIRIFEGNETAYFPFASLRPDWQAMIDQVEEAAQKAKEIQNGLRLIEEATRIAAVLPLDDEDYGHLWAYYGRKPNKTKEEAMRKLKAIIDYESRVSGGSRKGEALATVATQAGEHPNTLRNWLKRIKDVPMAHRLPCLVDGYTGRTAKAECSKDAWEFFKADWLRRGQPKAAACYDRLERAAKKHEWIIPDIRTLERRIVKELPREAVILARQGEDALKKCYPPQVRDHGVFHALEAVNGDGYTFWPHVDFGDGVIVRPTAWVWQDIYAGKLLAHRVGVSENTEIIRLASGDMVETYGIPEHWWFDNTRAAANKTMTGGIANRYRFKVKEEDPMGIVPMLGGQVHWATPGHGQAKPIERAFGVGGLSEYVDKHPAFAGRGTKAKPVPLAEFEQILANEVAAINARLGRMSPVCNGRSFDQVFNESYSRSTIRKATAEQRRLWLLACDNVTVDRNNASITIKFYNCRNGQNRYWDELLSPYAGRKITARFDPQNLQGAVHCYTLDGRYICEAACILAAGFNDAEAARSHLRARNSHKKATKAALAAELRMTTLEAAQLIPTSPGVAPEPTKVIQGAFGKGREAVSSEAEENDALFAKAVGTMEGEWRESMKNKI